MRPIDDGLDGYRGNRSCLLTARLSEPIRLAPLSRSSGAVPLEGTAAAHDDFIRMGRPPPDADTTRRPKGGRHGGRQWPASRSVNIPTNKRVVIALQYIHGIGAKHARTSSRRSTSTRRAAVNELSDAEVLQIRETIDRDYVVEGDLRREVAMNIKRLMDLGSYRGLRHRRGLPVRGQRTHTSARTRKGPAKPIAGKKK